MTNNESNSPLIFEISLNKRLLAVGSMIDAYRSKESDVELQHIVNLFNDISQHYPVDSEEFSIEWENITILQANLNDEIIKARSAPYEGYWD